MAGTITITEETYGKNNLKLILYDWLSDASGDASATASTEAYNGVIEKVVCEPDGGGTAPSDLYDVTVTDANSLDVLTGQGVDCPDAANLVITGGLLPAVNDKLSLTVTNGGNAKGGKVYVYVNPR